MFSKNKDNIQNLSERENYSQKSKFKYYFVISLIFLAIIIIIFFVFLNSKNVDKKDIKDKAQIKKINITEEIDPKKYTDIIDDTIAPWAAGDANLNMDIDDDYLLGYEEIEIYGTDPNNPDSDGDGFLDGEEVMKGYNPLGAGKL
jgi:flagellar biosynthesis/type III secretory pathway M-ring protein FliF/YscJ